MIKSKQRLGIPIRLTMITTVIVSLSFIALGSIAFSFLNRQITERTEAEITLVRKSFVHPLWFLDYRTIMLMTDDFLHNKGGLIKAIQVTTSDGELVVEKNNLEANSDLPFEQIAKMEHFEIISENIVFQNRDIGTVRVIVSKAPLRESLSKLFFSVLVGTLLAIGLFSSVLFLLIRHYISTPLNDLVSMANAFKNGSYDLRRQNWKLEFGVIEDAFLEGANAIRSRDEYLRNQNEALEMTIEERTKKIDAQRALLTEKSRLATLGEFSANIAHEINNPLFVITSSATLIESKLQRSGHHEEVAKDITKIQNMVHRISRIIKGLRTFARDASEEVKAEFQLAKMFEDIKDLCQARLTNSGINLTIDIQSPNMTLFAREIQISQVLINLINNAAEAIKDLPQKWIHISAQQVNQTIQISVTDSGFGIPPEIRTKMTQPFFTTKEKGVGTGLGLSIATGIISAHDGELLYDDSSVHTRFVISLPALKEEKAALQQPS